MMLILNKILNKIHYFLLQYKYLQPIIKEKNKYDVSEKKLHIKDENYFQISVAPIYKNKKAIITIISDDGEFETGKELFNLSNIFSMPITVAGTVRIIDGHLKEWLSIVDNSKIEIVNHSYNHLRMDRKDVCNNNRRLKHEIMHSKTYLEKFFQQKQFTFVCPENAMSDLGYSILEESGYYAVRRGIRGLNPINIKDGISPGEWFNLKCYGVLDTNIEEERMKWIEEAYHNHKWLIEMWHNVCEPDCIHGYQAISFNDASAHLRNMKEYAYVNNLWCASFTNAVKYLKEKTVARAISYTDGNDLVVGVFWDEQELDGEIFNHPLTLLVDTNVLPREIVDNGTVIKCNNKYMLNVLPNRLYRYKFK